MYIKDNFTMEKTKNQIVTEMYQAGLLNEDDTARYLIDESVNASDMNYIKQLILLCKSNQKEVEAGNVYSVDELIGNLKKRYESSDDQTDRNNSSTKL